MLVVLPKGTNLARAVENSLAGNGLADLEATLDSQRVIVVFPKFRLETRYSLANNLKTLGMPVAFSDKADLSGMDGTSIPDQFQMLSTRHSSISTRKAQRPQLQRRLQFMRILRGMAIWALYPGVQGRSPVLILHPGQGHGSDPLYGTDCEPGWILSRLTGELIPIFLLPLVPLRERVIPVKAGTGKEHCI